MGIIVIIRTSVNNKTNFCKMATPKRKLTSKSIETKYLAIQEVETGLKKKCDIAKEYGIPSNTLSTWLKKKDFIKEAYELSKFGPARKRQRTSNYEDVEKSLDMWFKDARAGGVPISGPILKARAEDLAKQLGHDNFVASNGFLHRFKERHEYTYKTICGEAASVSIDTVNEWKQGTLKNLLKEYQPDDIYNCDETGLFFKMEPNKTFAVKGDKCSGGKRSKERITVMPCSNMTGSHKLPLLVIGKSQRPRCFSGIDLHSFGVQYTHQKRAWMDSDIFTSWVKKLDNKIHIQGRKIALVLDNCRAHPHVQGLKAIKLFFLPPNTTSKTQPMEMGIIQNLKTHYRNLLVKRGLLPAVEKKIPFQWTLLDALSAIKDAWASVKPATISKCFKHCEFVAPDNANLEEEDDDEEDNIPLARLRENLQAAGVEFEDEELNLYLDIDSEVATSAALTDSAIIEEIKAIDEDETKEDELSNEQDVEVVPPSFADAMDAIKTLRNVLMTHTSDTDMSSKWQMLADMENLVESRHHHSLKQKTIKDFFK